MARGSVQISEPGDAFAVLGGCLGFWEGVELSDKSMSLLARVVSDSLDPGYEHYSERDVRPSFWWGLLTLVLSVALSCGVVIAAKTLVASSQGAQGTTQTLRGQVEAMQGRVAVAEAEVEELRSTAEALSGEAEAVDALGDAEILALGARATGSGLVVTLSEAAAGSTTAAIHDSDVRAVVNALWAGGAEAVAVGGVRLGPQTTIRTAGSSVLVSLQPVSAPYVIEAIGDGAALAESLRRDRAVARVRNSSSMSLSTNRATKLSLGGAAASKLWSASVMGGSTPSEPGGPEGSDQQ